MQIQPQNSYQLLDSLFLPQGQSGRFNNSFGSVGGSGGGDSYGRVCSSYCGGTIGSTQGANNNPIGGDPYGLSQQNIQQDNLYNGLDSGFLGGLVQLAGTIVNSIQQFLFGKTAQTSPQTEAQFGGNQPFNKLVFPSGMQGSESSLGNELSTVDGNTNPNNLGLMSNMINPFLGNSKNFLSGIMNVAGGFLGNATSLGKGALGLLGSIF